jgi:transposase-like protein
MRCWEGKWKLRLEPVKESGLPISWVIERVIYRRTLVTRVGKLELRVLQDRQGRFRTDVFERYQRSEKALVAALAEMHVQGVWTRKVKALTEELCGHEFSGFLLAEQKKEQLRQVHTAA